MRINLESVNRLSPRRLAYGAVFFSAFGGFMSGSAVFKYLSGRPELFSWIGDALVGFAFVAYGMFWAVMLVRRANSSIPRRDVPGDARLPSPSH
jgi:hypothetical protein